MDKKRLEIIITAVLILVLILSWAGRIKYIKGKLAARKTTPAAIAPKQAPAKPQEKKDLISFAVVSAKAQLPTAGTEGLSWVSDPFSGKVYTSVATNVQLDLKLYGIMHDRQKPAAIINNRVVSKGDRVGQLVVTQIGQDRVVLSDGLRDYVLRLGRQ
jgi:hypothetical protein